MSKGREGGGKLLPMAKVFFGVTGEWENGERDFSYYPIEYNWVAWKGYDTTYIITIKISNANNNLKSKNKW